MHSTSGLLRQIRRKQLLISIYQPGARETSAALEIAEITELLCLTDTECRYLVRRLQAKGIVACSDDADSTQVRLTPKGKRLVHRMVRGESQRA